MTENTALSAARKSSWLGGPVTLAILLLLLAGGVFAYFYFTNPRPEEAKEFMGFRAAVERQQALMRMAPEYADRDGDLVADPPATTVNPATLIFCEIAGSDPDQDAQRWKPFLDHLARTTGKAVQHWRPRATTIKDEEYGDIEVPPARGALGPAGQMAALRAGELHICAFSTGSVTAAVNTAGFVPVASPADAAGTFGYEMELLVPADSPVQKPEELRGKRIALVSMSSNSGGRAGLVFLRSLSLVPIRDYSFVFTGSHPASIAAVIDKRVDAAFVANDLLRAEINSGKVRADQIRSIYKSATFPPLCFGMAYNLEPALAAKIRSAFLSFTGLSSIYDAPTRVKFAAVDYKKDWAFVREIDEKLATVIEP